SVSSAVRRSTEVRSSSLTIRANVSFCPEVSPTTPTRSPTSTGVRPISRARIATTVGPLSSATPHLPRSLVITIPNFASLCRGRSLVRGREPLPGRTRTSDSSYRLAMSVEHLLPHLCKARQGLCGGFNVVDFYAFNAQTNNCAGGSHAVIGIRLPQPTVQRGTADVYASIKVRMMATAVINLGSERLEAASVRPAQVGNAGQSRGGSC